MAKLKTMRGQEVDTDLIKMKHQLMHGKKTETTIKREDYVTDRRRRSSSKRVSEMLANKQDVQQKLEQQKRDQAAQQQQPQVQQEGSVGVDEFESSNTGTLTDTAPNADLPKQETPKSRIIKK